jgi:hypothetical protein
MSDIEYHFPPVSIKNIDMKTVSIRNKKKSNDGNSGGQGNKGGKGGKGGKNNDDDDDTNEIYYYLTSELDSNNGSPNLYSHDTKLFYTLENLFIVGPISNKNDTDATMILSFKSIDDHNPKTKPSSQYMCFPLNLTNKSSDEHFLTGVLGSVDKPLISAIDLKEMFFKPTNKEIQLKKKNEQLFESFSPSNNMIDIFVHVYPDVTKVFYDPFLLDDPTKDKRKGKKGGGLKNPSKHKWITADVQHDMDRYEPVKLSFFMNNPEKDDDDDDDGRKKKGKDNFTTLWNWQNTIEPMETVTAAENEKLSTEEQIYIQCAPAGASEQTEMVYTSARTKKNKDKDSSHMSMIIVSLVVIFINLIAVGIAYPSIYGVTSQFFRNNIIEKRSIKEDDKRRDAFEMFAYWVADLFPHEMSTSVHNGLWGEGNKRNNENGEMLVRCGTLFFYLVFFLMFVFGLKKRNTEIMHLSIFVILILVFDLFLFFIQISNMTYSSYELMKDEA